MFRTRQRTTDDRRPTREANANIQVSRFRKIPSRKYTVPSTVRTCLEDHHTVTTASDRLTGHGSFRHGGPASFGIGSGLGTPCVLRWLLSRIIRVFEDGVFCRWLIWVPGCLGAYRSVHGNDGIQAGLARENCCPHCLMAVRTLPLAAIIVS